MEPAYHSGQLVIIDKTADSYQVGDVVLFSCAGLDSTLIKRVAACPGDRVLIRDGQLYVNASAVQGYSGIAYAGAAAQEMTVPEGCYFVLGDNSAESKDSRYGEVGIISEENILGRVVQRR